MEIMRNYEILTSRWLIIRAGPGKGVEEESRDEDGVVFEKKRQQEKE